MKNLTAILIVSSAILSSQAFASPVPAQVSALECADGTNGLYLEAPGNSVAVPIPGASFQSNGSAVTFNYNGKSIVLGTSTPFKTINGQCTQYNLTLTSDVAFTLDWKEGIKYPCYSSSGGVFGTLTKCYKESFTVGFSSQELNETFTCSEKLSDIDGVEDFGNCNLKF
jgi:hypothetical protein